MRILQISSASSLGGGERHFADLACTLSQRGHAVFAALSSRSPLRKELASLPPENIFTLPLRNALDVGSARELARLVRENRIEIVHAHLARDYPLAALAVTRNPAKLVLTRHVLFQLNPLHMVTFRSVSRVIAVSEAVRVALTKQRTLPKHKIVVIPNGIDFGRFDATLVGFNRTSFRRRIKVTAESVLVGTVGEIRQQKGLDDFLRAAAVLARQDPRTHFLIAGEDATRGGERRAALERLIATLHLKDRVHLAGWVDEIAPLMAALDVYVSPSRTESFGLSIVEAMASARAVVATATEGAREIIEEGRTGVIVPVGDWEAMAASVLRLIEDENERTRLGAAARVIARERFNLKRMVDATERLYLDLP